MRNAAAGRTRLPAGGLIADAAVAAAATVIAVAQQATSASQAPGTSRSRVLAGMLVGLVVWWTVGVPRADRASRSWSRCTRCERRPRPR